MKKLFKRILWVLLLILLIIVITSIVYILINSNKFANYFAYHPVEERLAIYENDPNMTSDQLDSLLNIPEKKSEIFANNEKLQKYYLDSLLIVHNLTNHDIFWLTTQDSFKIEALYFPSQNNSAIIFVHGFKDGRFTNAYLKAISIFVKNGYGVIYPTLRAHGNSDGETITFGKEEVRDIEASYQYLISGSNVDKNKIGIYGHSMGSAVSILYAAENSNIKAVIAETPYDSFDNTLGTTVEYFTGLPAFPFARIIKFYLERKLDFKLDDYDPVKYISKISPRPVFILAGGKDVTVNSAGGQNLVNATGEPVEYWYEPEYDHNGFRNEDLKEYEKRIIGFFDKYLFTKADN